MSPECTSSMSLHTKKNPGYQFSLQKPTFRQVKPAEVGSPETLNKARQMQLVLGQSLH